VVDVDELDEMFHCVDDEFISKGRSQKFSQMMKDYETSLFIGHKKEHNKFWVYSLTLLQMKADNGWSNKGFNELL
jgi:ABC-type polysaccharide/polyol phosphate transport system ATPase subunit